MKKEMRVNIFILISVIFIPLSGFAQINEVDNGGLRQGKWQKKYPDGRLMYEGYFKNGEPFGEWTRYYEGGQVKAKIKYNQNSDTASSVLFDQFGKKIAEGAYVDEKRTGKWQFFTDGRKISEEMYLDGAKHGISRTFYPTGETLEETEWQKGLQEGSYRVFFKNGDPYLQCKMSNGKRSGLCLSYFQNGRVEMEAYYLNNLRHDEWKYYNEKGKLKYILKYDQGKLLNPAVQDSINNLDQGQFEKKGNRIADPEDFMQDPSEYMMRMQNIR
jgi:antitoxin component YwqK of YwqJK toxin-antitoxin module